ncbi:serine palmitoyltransferase 2 isoform X2 [Cylas formicarius]|uniref:serine palmitoyltransferase 2 isoform X2 n=1 Tax=Cylas formicarius TaxID=197179 RepID=UPI0029585094|nr:serine palmitoyltransferase 2 isoform X2 [Cylas formicarius]
MMEVGGCQDSFRIENGFKKRKKHQSCSNITPDIQNESVGLKNGYIKEKFRDQHGHPKTKVLRESFEPPTFVTAAMTQISFYILMFLGFLSQLLFPPKLVKETGRAGYPPLYDRFSAFYSRYVYRRIRDCWNYPICSVPGSEVVLKDRVSKDNGWTFEFTGTKTKCLNLASYNYLGFAEASGPCAEAAIKSIYEYGISTGSTRQQYGTCALHDELESLMAEFVGAEDAITFGMGYATNSLNIPTLLEPGCLVISDEKNHASLIWGIKLQSVVVKVFKHNDVSHLEDLLKEAIYYGQPDQPTGVYKPWKKILIVVEGVYSMEGTIARLPEIIALKKKYKAYLYLDEAHSIGAMGKHGKGVVDYFNCDPKDIDVLMGTFTKSFGSAGGYIAGSKELITYLREESYASQHAWAMSPPLAAQIISVLKILMGKDGTNEGQKRIETLARNTRYFRMRLEQIGVIIHGNEDSPVVPLLVYLYSKIAIMVRTLIKEKIATVGVGYPATPLFEGRIRICLSAGHTKEQLDYALDVIDRVADECGLKYSRKPRDLTPIDYDKIKVYSHI